eukprot:5507726-Pleurochrysis_carterae.AAC.1
MARQGGGPTDRSDGQRVRARPPWLREDGSLLPTADERDSTRDRRTRSCHSEEAAHKATRAPARPTRLRRARGAGRRSASRAAASGCTCRRRADGTRAATPAAHEREARTQAAQVGGAPWRFRQWPCARTHAAARAEVCEFVHLHAELARRDDEQESGRRHARRQPVVRPARRHDPTLAAYAQNSTSRLKAPNGHLALSSGDTGHLRARVERCAVRALGIRAFQMQRGARATKKRLVARRNGSLAASTGG